MSRRVGVTGASGRVGHRMVALLRERGVEVVGVSRRDRADEPGTAWRRAELDDLGALERAVAGAHAVVHLAGWIDVGASMRTPAECHRANVLGTVHVLEACRRAGIRRFVNASSSHVYGVPVRTPVREDDPASPRTPYGASKLAAEILVRSYADLYGIEAASARISSVYGEDAVGGTVLADAAAQAVRDRAIALRDYTPVRDFIHVDEVAGALADLALAPRWPGVPVVNVGSGQGFRIEAVARLVADVAQELGLGPVRVLPPTGRGPDPIQAVVLACDRIEQALGWRARIPLAEGIRRVLEARLKEGSP